MARINLAVLAPGSFPQIHSFTPLISLVDRALAAHSLTEFCCYESPESRAGACDGGEPCGDPASEVIDGQPFCPKHARKARLDAALEVLRG